jgi:hypothetical protein
LLTPEMQRVGVTPALLNTTKKIKCPRCGLEFSLFQSRAIACKGCKQGAYGCQLVRCLRCDLEFPMDGSVVNGWQQQKALSGYMNNIVNNYNKSVGKRGSR